MNYRRKQVVTRLSLIGVVFLFAFSFVGSLLSTTQSVDALSRSDFSAGNIITETVFTNNSTMSVSQIQSFLNSKVPTCDTNGQQLSEYGGPDLNSDGKVQRWEWAKANYNQTTFPCLKGYTEGGKTSAEIIYNAAKEFQINPQVLLVLLQKEQALVTDTWPLNIQYRSATGYGCPDTAPCDSDYYGLTNQVRWAARMFRAIVDDSSTWYTPYETGVNYIQYNPSSSCGGSNVNIANRATQALYNYTPYQPNSATLAWKFEGGAYPSCGAFGNLNFFVYFNEWFGSTLTNASVKYTYYSSTTDNLGSTARIGVSLSTRPGANVTINYGITSPSNGAFVGSSSITIGPATWNSPEKNIITIKGLSNDSLTGNFEYWVRANRPVSTDKRFSYIGGDQVGHIKILHQKVDGADTPVYQLYSPSTIKHYYTGSLSEWTDLQTGTYQDRGTAFYFCSAGDTEIQSFVNDDNEQRLAIARSAEAIQLEKDGYTATGIGFTASSKGSVQVYEHYNPTTEHAFYSLSAAEGNASGYTQHTPVFTVCRQNDIPVYRLYKPETGTHYYTISSADRDKVITKGGYQYQGVAYYIQAGSTPVYHLYKPTTGTHYYTISEEDRDKVVAEGGYRYDGIAFSFEPGDLDVLRAYKPETGRHYYTISPEEIEQIKAGGYIPQGVAISISQ